jgi:hypothetical protein
MAKKISGAKTLATGRAGNPLPAEMGSGSATGAHGVTRPTKLKPSALLDTRVLKKTGSFYYHCDWNANVADI